MRRILVFTVQNIVLFMMLHWTINTNGQDNSVKEAHSTIKGPRRFISQIEFFAGPSIKYYGGDPLYEEANVLKVGYSGGVALVHEFNKQIVFIMRAAYENKGTKIVYSSLHTDYSPPKVQKLVHDIHINYITVTLLPAVRMIKGQKLSLGCGPYLGYLLNSRFSQELYLDGILISKSGGRPNPYDDHKKYDAGLTTMVGYQFFGNGKRGVNMQLLYSVGMVDINQPMITQTRTKVISLLFGMTINK